MAGVARKGRQGKMEALLVCGSNKKHLPGKMLLGNESGRLLRYGRERRKRRRGK